MRLGDGLAPLAFGSRKRVVGPLEDGRSPWAVSDTARPDTLPLTSRAQIPTPTLTNNSTMSYTEATAARELELYATNEKVYIAPVIRTLSRKWQEGVFDLDRAIAYIDRYCLVPAAKQYKLEHGSMTVRWDFMFPRAIRLAAAKSIARHWVTEFRLGNFWD